MAKQEKVIRKEAIRVIEGIKYYEESKKMKKEDFVKAHLEIYPFNMMDVDPKTKKVKAGRPDATKKLESIHSKL